MWSELIIVLCECNYAFTINTSMEGLLINTPLTETRVVLRLGVDASCRLAKDKIDDIIGVGELLVPQVGQVLLAGWEDVDRWKPSCSLLLRDDLSASGVLGWS